MVQIDKDQLLEKMADNLATLRTKLCYTQEHLASIIGVSRHTVLSIENKKRVMTWNTFLSLVFVFSLSQDTMTLMKALGIYTEQLEAFLLSTD